MTFLVQKIKCYVVNIQNLTAACETFKANPLASIVKRITVTVTPKCEGVVVYMD